MALERTKIINILDKIILISLYIFAFFFPISKALIEIASTLAIICYIAKKIIQREGIAKTRLNLAIVAYLAICFFSIFTSSNPTISTRVFFGKVVQNVLLFFVLVEVLTAVLSSIFLALCQS